MNKSDVFVGPRAVKRCGRRAQKNICLSPVDPYSGMLTTGTGRFSIPIVFVSIILRQFCGREQRMISLIIEHGSV